jgi:hypothetical protein
MALPDFVLLPAMAKPLDPLGSLSVCLIKSALIIALFFP